MSVNHRVHRTAPHTAIPDQPTRFLIEPDLLLFSPAAPLVSVTSYPSYWRSVMQELSCTWVPGTFDIVRLKFAGRTVEMTATRLARLFGKQALHDLYLKGSARLKVDAREIALLS